MDNTPGYALIGFGIFLLLIGIYYYARKGHNLSQLKVNSERGCLFGLGGLAVLSIGAIVTGL